MRRSDLEHLIRAAGAIANDTEIIVVGSQSVLGQFPNAPAALLVSAEADVYPRHQPELADLVDGSIGEGSPFHEEYGYYAQGVGPETATLPRGWQTRLVPVCNPNTNGITGLCLEVHDLAISKYVARRPKDQQFTRELARHGMTQRDTLMTRLHDSELPPASRQVIAATIDRDFSGEVGLGLSGA